MALVLARDGRRQALTRFRPTPDFGPALDFFRSGENGATGPAAAVLTLWLADGPATVP